MREEISRLTAVVVAQGGVVVPGVGASMGGGNVNMSNQGHSGKGMSMNGGRGREEPAPVSVTVSLPNASMLAHAPSGGGHYGY